MEGTRDAVSRSASKAGESAPKTAADDEGRVSCAMRRIENCEAANMSPTRDQTPQQRRTVRLLSDDKLKWGALITSKAAHRASKTLARLLSWR